MSGADRAGRRVALPRTAPAVPWLAISLLVTAACSAPGGPAPSPAGSVTDPATTTFVIVRHAEKRTDQGRDPDLTEKGRARAEALSAVVAGADVAAVYHTPYARTRQTVAPAAGRFGLEPVEIPYSVGEEAAHADALVAHVLRHHAGRTVVYSGHTTTVPAVLRRLGVSGPDEIPETDYANLFIVVRKDGSAGLLHGRHGP